jgi:hypothetical protein
MKNESFRHSLIIEAEYFRLHKLLNILLEADRQRIDTTFPNSTLLEWKPKMKLNDFYNNWNQNWLLIYKASRDGFDANAFHSRCDNKDTFTEAKNFTTSDIEVFKLA